MHRTRGTSLISLPRKDLKRIAPAHETGVFAPPSSFYNNGQCVREPPALVDPQTPLGVLIHGQADLAINKLHTLQASRRLFIGASALPSLQRKELHLSFSCPKLMTCESRATKHFPVCTGLLSASGTGRKGWLLCGGACSAPDFPPARHWSWR